MSTLGEALARAPHRFDAIQAVRVAEIGHRPLGTDALPEQEGARLTAEQSLAFAATPVSSVSDAADGRRHLRSAFLGLTGPLGALPRVYTEAALAAERVRNRALAAFFDLFNHRLASLFARAADKYRLGVLVQREAVRPDRPSAAPRTGTDPVSHALLALAGFGTLHIGGRSTLPDETVLHYAGLFACRNRPVAALSGMLADYLGFPVRVVQFAGGYVPVPPEEQTRLFGSHPAFGRLGVDTVAGSRVWQPEGAIRIVAGPVRLPQFLALMPEQPKLARLTDLVRAYIGPDMGFDVQVILAREDIPAARLDGGQGPGAPRLGWNTWALGLPALADSDEVILNPDVLDAALARKKA